MNKKGFTLIELLVVIAIIGLLSTLAVVALGSARVKARDSKRVSDLKQVQTALELYYTDNNAYPAGNALLFGEAAGCLCLGSAGLVRLVVPIHIWVKCQKIQVPIIIPILWLMAHTQLQLL